MQLKLSYTEIENFVESKTNRELPISYGGPHTLHLSYKVPLMSSVGLDINVDRILGTDLILSYGGGAGIEFMVRTALKQFQSQNQPGSEILEILDGSRLLIALGKSENLGPLFDRIDLQDIHFDEQSVMIDFTPKP